MRKKKPVAHENHERWLVSYADFITLLFAFFVVMFATSQTDHSKTQQVQDSVRRAIEENQFVSVMASILGGDVNNKGKGNAQMKGPGGTEQVSQDRKTDGKYVELVPAMKYLEQELADEISKGMMSVSMEPRGLVVSFREAAFFPSGTDVIPEQTYDTVAKVGQVMEKLPNPVRLEGHTDSIPLRGGGRFRSNWELSAARSIAMMELLVSYCNIPRDRLSIAGYADNAPIADNDTEDGRRRNRRVDIVILNQTGLAAEPATANHGKPAAPATAAH
ncbi:MAG: flagellar motor protein MotB [Acidobacteriota bacterium]